MQGIGQMLMEDIRFDPAIGQMLTGSFMDYAMPRAGDLSRDRLDSNPVPTKTNPLGVKGAGEAGAVGAMPAVANALVDALSPLGIRHVENARHPRAPMARHPRRPRIKGRACIRAFPGPVLVRVQLILENRSSALIVPHRRWRPKKCAITTRSGRARDGRRSRYWLAF